MRFTVSWLRSAELELAQLWLNAEDRTALASAANEIDRLLTIRNRHSPSYACDGKGGDESRLPSEDSVHELFGLT